MMPKGQQGSTKEVENDAGWSDPVNGLETGRRHGKARLQLTRDRHVEVMKYTIPNAKTLPIYPRSRWMGDEADSKASIEEATLSGYQQTDARPDFACISARDVSNHVPGMNHRALATSKVFEVPIRLRRYAVSEMHPMWQDAGRLSVSCRGGK